MVEPWSSKPYVWVRSPLSLNIVLKTSKLFNIKPYNKKSKNYSKKTNNSFKALLPYKNLDKFFTYNEHFNNFESIKIITSKTYSYLLFVVSRNLTVRNYITSIGMQQIFNKYLGVECHRFCRNYTIPPVSFFNFFTKQSRLLCTSNTNPKITKILIEKETYFYLEYYFSLLLHNYLLRKVNNNRVFSLYPVKNSHFTKTSSFAPPIENIIKFKKFIFKSHYVTQPFPSIFLLKIYLYTTNTRRNSGVKSFYKSFFKAFIKFKSLLKRKGSKFKFVSIKKTAYRINYNLNKLLSKRFKYLSFLHRRSNHIISSTKKKIMLKKLKKLSNISTIYKPNISTNILFFKKKQDYNFLKKSNFSLSLHNIHLFG